MSNETHKHYHINILPQDAGAWIAIAVALAFAALFWSLAKSDQARYAADAEKAKYEAQAKISAKTP